MTNCDIPSGKLTVCELENGPFSSLTYLWFHSDIPVRYLPVYQRVIKVDFQYLTQSQEWSQVMSCHVHLEQEAILWEIDRDWTQLLQVDGEMKQFIVMWNSNRWTMFDHVIVSLAGFSCPQADKTGIPSYFDVALPFLCCSYLDDITP